jgi:predicted XRE-type DNA-binding protein
MPESITPSERWLPVVGYEGLYEVSDLGRVRSLPRQTTRGVRGGGIMALCESANGHLAVKLSNSGVQRGYQVHQLVMYAFVGLPPAGHLVGHGPGGGLDNRLVNLSYKTVHANSLDRYRDGTLVCGEAHPSSRLTQAQVDEIRDRYSQGGISQRELASEFGIQRQSVSKIVAGSRWRIKATDMPQRLVSTRPAVPELPETSTQEHWLPVVGWEGLYEVSDLGSVRSMRRWAAGAFRGGRMLRPADAGRSMLVSLSRDGKHVTRKVHHLVAEAFVGPRIGRIVRHGPAGYKDNRLSNLQYGTLQDNSDDQLRDGTRRRGEAVYLAKLTWAKVHQIRSQHAGGEPIKKLAANYGVSPASIRLIVNGKTWRI